MCCCRLRVDFNRWAISSGSVPAAEMLIRLHDALYLTNLGTFTRIYSNDRSRIWDCMMQRWCMLGQVMTPVKLLCGRAPALRGFSQHMSSLGGIVHLLKIPLLCDFQAI